MEKKSIIEELKEYLANTPKEVLKKDWADICEATKDIKSPTVEEYLQGFSVWHSPDEIPPAGFYFAITDESYPCIAFSDGETLDVMVAVTGIRPKVAKWMHIPD